MKIVLAFDSFKGCLSSEEIIKIATKSIRKIVPKAEIKGFIIADGGEGTLDSLIHGSNGKIKKNALLTLRAKLPYPE